MTASARGREGVGERENLAGQGRRGQAAAAALFAGAGEVRTLARTLDWGATPLGWPDAWSPALRIATGAMLDAPHPICLWAGPEYALVYNDAYRRILAAKHPAALGQPGSVVWAEIWEGLAPQFAQVSAGGPAVYGEDARFVMARLEGGGTEDAWFSYSLSALRDEDGSIVAVLNISPETTARVRAEQALEAERARLAEVVRLAPAFMAVLRGPDHVIALTNADFDALVGRRDVCGRSVADALPETVGQGFVTLLDRVLATGEPFVGREVPYRRPDAAGVDDVRYVDFVYQALTEAGGTHSGVFVHGVDVTDQVRARGEVERLLVESRAANAQLEEQQLELELTNQQLQDQAAELEAQTEALQATAAELEARTAEADAARARSEAVLGSIADPFILLDRDWRITLVNDAAEPPLQTGRSRLLGRTLWDAFPGLESSQFEPFYREAMMEGRPTAVEGYFALLNAWFDVHIYPWAAGLMVHFRDVSARKQAEAERERLLAEVHGANAELRRLAASAQTAERRAHFLADLGQALQPLTDADAVMETTARLLGEYLGADRCSYAEVEADEDTSTITGNYTRGDTISILGRFAIRAFGAEALRLMRANAAYVVDDAATDPRVTPPDRVAYAATQIRAVVCVPLHKGGRFVAAVAVHQRAPRAWTPDEVELVVTVVQRCWEALERARALRRLRESEAAPSQLAERTAAAEAAQRAAEEANQAKTAFLSAMSHELRTPLNAIGGYAELLALGVRGPVTDAQRTDLERLLRANQHMAGLVTTLLDFARVEAGQIAYHLEAVPLGPLVQDVEALIRPQFAAKELAYDHDGCGPETPDRPHTVWADPEKVRQVLLNLLTNAAKFTDVGGQVALACATDRAAGVVRIRVTDTGRGIAPEQLTRVFEPFVQLDRQRTQGSQQGVGLGLAISRDLARGMGGDLTAESTPGVGSTFTLTLPVGDGSPTASESE